MYAKIFTFNEWQSCILDPLSPAIVIISASNTAHCLWIFNFAQMISRVDLIEATAYLLESVTFATTSGARQVVITIILLCKNSELSSEFRPRQDRGHNFYQPRVMHHNATCGA